MINSKLFLIILYFIIVNIYSKCKCCCCYKKNFTNKLENINNDDKNDINNLEGKDDNNNLDNKEVINKSDDKKDDNNNNNLDNKEVINKSDDKKDDNNNNNLDNKDEIKQIFYSVKRRNENLFDYKINLDITLDQIESEIDVNKLKEFKNILNKKALEITKIEEDLKNEYKEEIYDINKEDTNICTTIDEFKKEFNNRKKLIELKDNEISNKLQNNDPNEDQFNHYYSVYKRMTEDIFTHEISVDLTIYVYILDLIGIINALNNVIKKEKLQYWIFLKFLRGKGKLESYLDFAKGGFLNFIENEDKILNLDLTYDILYNSKLNNCYSYKSGQLDIESERFKYLRCSGCNNDNCVSCKLREFLQKEKMLLYFTNIFKEQSKNSNSKESLKIKNLIFLSLRKMFKNLKFYEWNNKKKYIVFETVELTNKISLNLKKCVLLEWALTMEFLDRFIKEILDPGEVFDLYRAVKQKANIDCKLSNISIVDFFESSSMLIPAYVELNPNFCSKVNYFKIKDFKTYRCLFSYIISPNEETMFTALSLYNSVDYEQEIGYIPINQEWVRINDLENGKTSKEYYHFESRNKLIDDQILNFLLKNLKKDSKYKGKKVTIFEKLDSEPFKIDNKLGTFDL